MIVTGTDVVARAREWVGAPWVHQGRSRLGCDCGGLAIGIGRELGLDVVCGYVDYTDYPRNPANHFMVELMRQYMRRINLEQMQAGDWMHFQFSRIPQHIGMYTGDGGMIHATNQVGVERVIEIPLTQKWRDRLAGVYRYKGVA